LQKEALLILIFLTFCLQEITDNIINKMKQTRNIGSCIDMQNHAGNGRRLR